jgi:hypothetical protein
VELIRSRLGAQVHHRTIAAAKFGGEVARLYLDLLHRFECRHDCGLAGVVGICIHRAIEHKVVAAIAIAVYGDDGRVGKLGGTRITRYCRRSRAETGEAGDVPLRNGQIVELILRDGVGETRIAGNCDVGLIGRDQDDLIGPAHLQLHVELSSLADLELQVILLKYFKTGGRNRNGVRPGREFGHNKRASIVRHTTAGLSRVLVLCFNG